MDIQKSIDKLNKTLQYVYVKYNLSDNDYGIYENFGTHSAIIYVDTFDKAKKKAKHENQFFTILEKEKLLIKSLPIHLDLSESLGDLLDYMTEKTYKDYSFSLNEILKFHKKNWIKHELQD